MLGGYGWQATLQTPELVLNNDTVFEVTVTAWAKVSSGWTDLYIYSENDTKTLTFEKSESKTFTVEMKNGIEKIASVSLPMAVLFSLSIILSLNKS